MAFMLKNRSTTNLTGANSRQGFATVAQAIHVQCPSRTLPATTTDQLFRVRGGRVLVWQLVGEVTTAIQNQANNLKVSSKKLDASSAAVGTAVDVAANVDVANRELGGLYFVEGDGTAGVLSNAGAAFIGPNSGSWIAPQGEIYITTSATNTGATKWDLWYQPLDEGAYVDPVVTATAAI
jgi:hypothetical protein